MGLGSMIWDWQLPGCPSFNPEPEATAVVGG